MSDDELIARIAHFWSEWTDDMAPLQERGLFTQAARDFVTKFDITPKEAS